jgi:hypothetical protein
MSFILESIKQAERERKLGQQQVPEISIEYTGAHIENIEDNKTRWRVFLIGLTVSAIIVWASAYYLTNSDRRHNQQVSDSALTSISSGTSISASTGALNADANVDIASKDQESLMVDDSVNISVANNSVQQKLILVPDDTLHTSDLKSVKLITKESKTPTQIAVSEEMQANQLAKKNLVHLPIAAVEGKNDANVKSYIEKPSNEKSGIKKSSIENPIQAATEKIKVASDKQVLAKIYADLAALEDDEPNGLDVKSKMEQVGEKQVQIKTANYVVPEVSVLPGEKQTLDKLPSDTNYRQQHERAISSGVPSFGELPYDVQERIPDFNVSVHMFHADPLQRRIRINGQMYTEGKNLQRDLALVEITRYGAVFDYQGSLFRFNVR